VKKPIFRISAGAVLALGLAACASPVALLDATFDAGGETVRARVKFTAWTQPPAPSGDGDANLRLRFQNSEGDSLDFVLAPVSGTFPTGSYAIDGSANKFEASVTVGVQPEPVSLTSSDGLLEFTVLTMSEGLVRAMAGQFQVNLDGGGLAVGQFNVGAQ
jgi:hypothetical protein